MEIIRLFIQETIPPFVGPLVFIIFLLFRYKSVSDKIGFFVYGLISVIVFNFFSLFVLPFILMPILFFLPYGLYWGGYIIVLFQILGTIYILNKLSKRKRFAEIPS